MTERRTDDGVEADADLRAGNDDGCVERADELLHPFRRARSLSLERAAPRIEGFVYGCVGVVDRPEACHGKRQFSVGIVQSLHSVRLPVVVERAVMAPAAVPVFFKNL